MKTATDGDNGLRLSGTDDAGSLQGQRGFPDNPPVAVNGFYSIPRECPCGDSHLSRDLYWKHRLESESA